jgi:hypothetical protein
MEYDEVITRCYEFVRSIGIEIEERPIEGKTFTPGITITRSKIIVDRNGMKYPGDLLHEAGHIALLTEGQRTQLNGDATMGLKETEGYELGVLIWSYFAALKAGIPPEAVFHPDGYKGESEWLLENYGNKKYIGLPLLEWMKIAKRDETGEVKIISWLRV